MSTNPEARAWIEVRADALRSNYRQIRRQVGPEVGLLPMVKANGYGLGAERVLAVLEAEGPWGFGVATVEEALGLRRLGFSGRVMVCSPIPPAQASLAVQHDVELSVSNLATLASIRDAATRLGRAATVHVDVDTGMGRSGFDPSTSSEWLPEARACFDERVHWAGVYTHLHSADESEASVRVQAERLERFLEQARPLPDGLVVHLLNSPGAFRTPGLARSVVRPGIFLYGGEIGEGQPRPDPVVSVRARVVHLRDAGPGTTLGYGTTYVPKRPERWATLSIGYGDGLPRVLSNRGNALVRGHRVRIIGRISMDVTVVNITDVPGVELGDVATLLGFDGDEAITVDDVAQEAGTISYEVLTGLTPRLPRVWTASDG